MLISTIDYSPYLGRLGIGRIERGTVKVGDVVALLPIEGTAAMPTGTVDRSRVTKLFAFEGLERREVQSADAGEIVALRFVSSGGAAAGVSATLTIT